MRGRGSAFALVAVTAALVAAVPTSGRSEPAGAAAVADTGRAAVAKVPRLASGQVDVAGRIVSSTRGRGGAVRLEIEGADGKRLPALLPSDDDLEQHGQSLEIGRTVVLRGSMVEGSRPALVVTAVVVDGEPIALRKADEGRGPTAARAEKQKAGSTSAARPAAPSR